MLFSSKSCSGHGGTGSVFRSLGTGALAAREGLGCNLSEMRLTPGLRTNGIKVHVNTQIGKEGEKNGLNRRGTSLSEGSMSLEPQEPEPDGKNIQVGNSTVPNLPWSLDHRRRMLWASGERASSVRLKLETRPRQ